MLVPPFTAGAMVEIEVVAGSLFLVGSGLVLVLVVSVSVLVFVLVVLKVFVFVFVFVFFEVVPGARRVTLPREASRPEGEKAADDEAQDTEINWKVDCEDGLVLVADSRVVFMKGTRGCSLIELPPGGEMRPEADSQPLGREVEAEGEPVATQGQTSGVVQLEDSLCVPLQGIGIPEAVDVMVGADWVSVGSSALLPLILPPLETMDSHVPDLSP